MIVLNEIAPVQGPLTVNHKDCSKCGRDIYIRPRHQLYHVKCEVCLKYMHVYCVFLPYNRRKEIMYSHDTYICDDCNSEILPFHTLDDIEFAKVFYNVEIKDLTNLPDLSNDKFLNSINFTDPQSESEHSLIPNSSHYSSADEFHHKIDSNQDNLSFLHLNINSLNEKSHEDLCDLLRPLKSKISMIALSETRLKPNSDFSRFNIPGYQPLNQNVRHDSSTHAGGVAIYIRDGLNCFPRPDLHLNINDVENLFYEIVQPGKNIIFGLIYRHPRKLREEIDNFTIHLEKSLEKINNEKKLACITGDINLNLINYEHVPAISEYLNMLFSNFFYPAITKPTRIVPHHTPSLLDHFYFNSLDIQIDSNICVYPISDHLPIYSIINEKPIINKENICKRSFKNFNKAEFLLYLQYRLSDFQEKAINETCPSVLYDKFYKIFISSLNKFAPYRKINKREAKLGTKPWITKGILKSIKNKTNLYRNFYLSKIIERQNFYKRYCNILSRVKERSKIMYYKKSFNDIKNNSKKTWKMINNIVTLKPKSNLTPKLIMDNNNAYTNPEEIANKFNHFFRNVGPNLAKNIPKAQKSYTDYLKNPIQETFQPAPCNENEIIKIIKDLKNSNSIGLDLLPTNIIKMASNIIALPLKLVFNLSLLKGIFPDKLKHAKIIPIYKSLSHKLLTNYRPISILSCVSKILEKLMLTRLMNYLNEHKILYKNQFGFRKLHSTHLALLEITDTIYKNLDDGNYLFSLYVDLSKAFDTVNFDILLQKLEYYGIRGSELDWFTSYISSRKQTVEIDKKTSESLETVCGVPQGSNLGPLLFLLYINDLPNSSGILKYRLFADDTKIYIASKSLYEIQDLIDSEFPKLTEWFNANKLSLNLTKTHFVLYKPRNKPEPLTLTLILNNEIIKRSSDAKYLGIYFDEQMTWNKQIEAVKLKLSKSIGIFYKLRRFLPNDILRTLYYAIIQPHITYGIMSWGSAAPTLISTIQGKQNRVIKIIYNLPWRQETKPIYFSYKFLKINEQYHMDILRFVHRYHNDLLPAAFESYFTPITAVNPYPTRLASGHNYRLPQVLKNYGLNSPSYVGIKLWAQVDNNAKFLNVDKFKSYSFNHMLSRYI